MTRNTMTRPAPDAPLAEWHAWMEAEKMATWRRRRGPKARRLARLTEHLGPGPHPSGTSQMSHSGKLVTSDIKAAAMALGQGRRVELSSVREVGTLLEEMAAIANEAKAKGAAAPNYDLCRVSVPGTNLFCIESKGIPRVKMPQLKGMPVEGSAAALEPRTSEGEVDAAQKFIEHLNAAGIRTTRGTELASRLKATQSQLVGAKVAGMMAASLAGKYDPSKAPIFISREGYVLDGHHRWAATVGRDSIDGHLGDLRMNVITVDMSITELLGESNRWTRAFGIAAKAAGKGADVGAPRRKLRESRLSRLIEAMSSWNEAMHPREPGGSPRGGQFAPKGDAGEPGYARSPMGLGLAALTDEQRTTLAASYESVTGANMDADIDRMADDLLAHYDDFAAGNLADYPGGAAARPGLFHRAQAWYAKAHNRGVKWAARYGVPEEVVFGMQAACSPQRDWPTNERDVLGLLEVMKNDEAVALTADNAAVFREKVKGVGLEELGLKAGVPYKPSDMMARARAAAAEADAILASGRKGAVGDAKELMAKSKGYLGVIAMTHGMYGAMPPSRVTPSGRTYDPRLPNGQVALGNHIRALQVMRSGSPDKAFTFGPSGADSPKIRSFYNNIAHPGRGDWATVDAHMVRAMISTHPNPATRKTGLSDPAKILNGGSAKGLSGAGLYPAFAEAIIRAGKKRGIPPATIQAAVWTWWQQGQERKAHTVAARKENVAKRTPEELAARRAARLAAKERDRKARMGLNR